MDFSHGLLGGTPAGRVRRWSAHDLKYVCGLTKLQLEASQKLTRTVTAPWPRFCWAEPILSTWGLIHQCLLFLDEDALEELARSGWLASSEEGAALLKPAIERDDVAIARRLIELGSDLDGPPNNRLPPLLSARSSSMVDLLVKAGANPNERPIGKVAARTP